jgi:ABC-2 type transport system ATP-binding protein
VADRSSAGDRAHTTGNAKTLTLVPSSPEPSLAVRCRGLVKRYGDVTAVAGLDLEVRRGECFGLLGPNGAGKTTTIEILEGLLSADEGDVEVLGMRWDRDERELRERLGVQLQETLLNEKLSVLELLRLFRSFYRNGRSVDDVLKLVELESKRDAWFSKLSGGQKQRLGVACALVSHPELLFLDEPTTGLDPQSRRQLWDVLGRFRAEGGTVLLTTHYMEEAEILCDRVAVIDRGRVIALGTPRELIASLGAEHVVTFTFDGTGDDLTADVLATLAGVRDVRLENGAWSLATSQVHLVIPALLERIGARGGRLTHLSTHSATLEDVFVSLTGRHLRDE